MFCIKCGSLLKEGVKFCAGCGAGVSIGQNRQNEQNEVKAALVEKEKEAREEKYRKTMKRLAIVLVVALGLAILTRKYGLLPDGPWVDIVTIVFILCFIIPVVPIILNKITGHED